MTLPGTRDWLADALADMGPKQAAVVAAAAGVHPRLAANAIAARPVATIYYLRLCAAALLNPAPAIIFDGAIPAPSDFDFGQFACGFKITRGLRKHSDRDAASACGISPSTVGRLEAAEAVQIGVALRACAYVGLHPYKFFKPLNVGGYSGPSVSRETLQSGDRAAASPGAAANETNLS